MSQERHCAVQKREIREQIWNWRASLRRENPSPAQRRFRFNMTISHIRLRGRILLLEVAVYT